MSPEDHQSEVRQIIVRPLVVPDIITFPAEVDTTNAQRCGSELLAALRPGVTVIIADMSQTRFCDSMGVRYLLIAGNAAQHHGAELRVVVTGPAVLRMMRLLGVDQVLRIYGNMADALSSPLVSP